MSRRKPVRSTSLIRRLVQGLFGRGKDSQDLGRTGRNLRFESLEGRALLAADLASIAGNVSLAGNPVENAQITLYLNDGDALFEPGTDDVLVETDTTDATGAYRFDRLEAGGYWVRQVEQTAGAIDLGESISDLITITPANAAGTAGTVIDDFNDIPEATVTADDDTNPDSLAADYVGALGGERDMIVTRTAGSGPASSVVLTSFEEQLLFGASIDATGDFNVVYDGNDSDATTLAATGLAGVDLTQVGANAAIKVAANANQAGTTARLRIYTDATNYSDLTIAVPNSGTPEDLVFYFEDFVTGAGAAGAATFTNVGAIDLLVETTVGGTDGSITVLGAYAQNVLTQDFTNQADLSLTKEVNNATPNVGDDVVFTLTLNNAGPAGATNVQVTDILPAGLTFVSDVGDGAFNAGIWTLDSVPVGASPSLQITATVTSLGAKTNSAEITAVDQVDPDSTPNNDVPAEDDQASDTVTPLEIDLSVTKAVDVANPNVGDEVTFTIIVSNAGPDDATGVALTDMLPAGLSFVSFTATQGNYVSGTGVWTIGGINATENAMLTITATVNSLGAKVNTAEITVADQADTDSTPGNAIGGEDDQASDTVTPQEINLSLTKTVDVDEPELGSDVVFTIVIANAGPDAATNVVVEDILPEGMEFVSATEEQGDYDEMTGLWTVGTIASGEDFMLQITATVISNGAKINAAQVVAADQADTNSTPDNLPTVEDDSDEVTVTPLQIDLSLTKSVDDDTPDFGQQIVFTIVVTNDGPGIATNVVVQDLLPSGINFDSALESQGDYVAGTGVWTVGDIASGGSATLEITATVDTFLARVNTAEVTAADQTDIDSTPDNQNPGEDDQDSATVTPNFIDLAVTKTVTDSTPNVNDVITFTITVTNTGNIAATGVVVEDLLPDGLEYDSELASQGTYDEVTGVWTVGAIAADDDATLQITVTVTGNGSLTNTAEVTAADQDDLDSTPDNQIADEDDQASSTVTINPIDLSISKSVAGTPTRGGTITFTIVVSNTGASNATGVVVRDQLPAGLDFVSATVSQGAEYDEVTGLWNVGAIDAGEDATLTIVATVETIGDKTNTAEVIAADQPDVDSTPDNQNAGEDDQDSVVVSPVVADLSLTKTVNDDTPDKNQSITFTIVVTNTGAQAATNVQVTDLLPAGLTFSSFTATQGTYVAGTGIWTVGTVAGNDTETLTITATVATAGAKINTAEITAVDQFDSDSSPGNNQAGEDDQASATVTPNQTDLSLTKTVNIANPNRGQQVEFTVTVTNNGTIGATGVNVTDVLPAGMTFGSATASAGDYNSATGLWQVGNLANGASATLTIRATATTTGAKVNTAEITAVNQFDPDSTPGNNQAAEDDQASATVTPNAADLSITKSVNNATQVVGQNVTFTVVVTNMGPQQATGVQVTDLLPAGLTFVSATQTQGAYAAATGIWTVGTIANGGTATLTITATVANVGAKNNTAQITASDQLDPDSTPGNNAAGEDDQASAAVNPPPRFSKRMFLAR